VFYDVPILGFREEISKAQYLLSKLNLLLNDEAPNHEAA
jgi:hypothetical protein